MVRKGGRGKHRGGGVATGAIACKRGVTLCELRTSSVPCTSLPMGIPGLLPDSLG